MEDQDYAELGRELHRRYGSQFESSESLLEAVSEALKGEVVPGASPLNDLGSWRRTQLGGGSMLAPILAFRRPR